MKDTPWVSSGSRAGGSVAATLVSCSSASNDSRCSAPAALWPGNPDSTSVDGAAVDSAAVDSAAPAPTSTSVRKRGAASITVASCCALSTLMTSNVASASASR